MDDLPTVVYLASLDAMRTFADALRVRLFDLLVPHPLTVTQLGGLVHESPAKVLYHIRELERIGVVHLVETRERGGVVEKYYRAVAASVAVTPELLQSAPPSELATMVNEFFLVMRREALAALENRLPAADPADPFTLTRDILWATRDEYAALITHVLAVLKTYDTPHGMAGEQAWVAHLVAHQLRSPDHRETPAPVTPPEP